MLRTRFQLGPVFLIVIALLVPIVPFVIFGAWMESTIVAWLEQTFVSDRPFVVATATTFLLSADILLPIPSSVVCTFAGRALGVLPGLMVNWLGLNVSCVVGYWLGVSYGRPVVQRFANSQTLDRLQNSVDQSGYGTAWMLTVCRALPVFAEASVLLAGLQRLPARKFYPPVVAANLGIAIAWSVLGSFASAHGWFPAAIAIACAAPLILLSLWNQSDAKLSNTG